MKQNNEKAKLERVELEQAKLGLMKPEKPKPERAKPEKPKPERAKEDQGLVVKAMNGDQLAYWLTIKKMPKI